MIFDWSYIWNNWSLIELVILYIVLFVGFGWEYYEERNYPWYYRLLYYLGFFLLFGSFVLAISIGNWFGVNRKFIGVAMLLLMGGGAICVGISYKIIPETYDTEGHRKKYWKMIVAIGGYFICLSFFSWF